MIGLSGLVGCCGGILQLLIVGFFWDFFVTGCKQVHETFVRLHADGKHHEYAKIIGGKCRPEVAKDVKEVDGIAAVGVHAEVGAVENKVHRYAKCDDGIHKDHGFKPGFEVWLDLLGEHEIDTEQRSQHMAQRFSRVEHIGLFQKVEKVGLLGADEGGGQHADVQKRDRREGVFLNTILEDIGEGNDRENEGTDVIKGHKRAKRATNEVAVIPHKEEDNVSDHKDQIANLDVDLFAIKNQKSERDEIKSSHEPGHLYHVHSFPSLILRFRVLALSNSP